MDSSSFVTNHTRERGAGISHKKYTLLDNVRKITITILICALHFKGASTVYLF